MADLAQLVEELSKLTVLEAADLSKMLEEKWGVSAAAPVAVAAAGVELAEQIARLAPFGNGNEEPVLALPRARVVRADWIGRVGGTLRAFVVGEGGGGLKAMVFRAAGTPLGQALGTPGAPVHLAGTVRAEEWNGTVSASFIVSDAAPA